MNHSRCLLQKLRNQLRAAALGDQPRAAGREQNPGGVADRWQLQGKQQGGIKSRNTQNCALGNQYPWMTPKCILILSSLHFYKAELSSRLGCHHCSKCVTCALQDSVPQVELPPSSVTVQKWVFYLLFQGTVG